MPRRYPDRPYLGVGGVVIHENRVLLARRGHEPLAGYWSIPGGVVECGESLAEAVRRELFEETGLIVEPLGLVEVFERITSGREGRTEFHFVVLDYICRLVGGALAPASDVSAVEWFSRGDFPDPVTQGAPAVIAKAFEWADRANLRP